MYIYTVGYGSPEDSDYAYLYHEKKLTEKQLEKLVHKAVVAVLKVVLLQQHNYTHNYADVHDEVARHLIEHEGFQKVAVQAHWDCFGWASIFVDDGWKMYRDAAIQALQEAVQKAGFSKVHDTYLRHNEESEKTRLVSNSIHSKPTCRFCFSNDNLQSVMLLIYKMPDGQEVYQGPQNMCDECCKVFEGQYKLCEEKPEE